MALLYDLGEGSVLQDCPCCGARVSKKSLTTHTNNCFNTYEETLKDWGVIRCPLYRYHIMPKKFLNHHLGYDCDEVMNLLRKYFQKDELLEDVQPAPDSFLADVPDDILNKDSKHILYTLREHLQNRDISEELNPSKEEQLD